MILIVLAKKMMILQLASEAKLKYHLDLHNEVGDPDKYDKLFDILNHLIKVILAKGKELDMPSLKFTAKSLKYVFGEKIKDETFRYKTVTSLKDLIHSGHLTVKGQAIYITKRGITHFYTIHE